MMRSLSLFMVILSGLGGAWLILQGDFTLPNRFDPALATHFPMLATRLLGAAMVALALAGIHFMAHMASGRPVASARRWQQRQFVLLSLSIVLFTAAFLNAEVVPNPDYRAPSRTHHAD